MVTVGTVDHRAMKSGTVTTPYSQCDDQEWELKTVTASSAITDSVDWFSFLLISVDILCGKKHRFHCNVMALALLMYQCCAPMTNATVNCWCFHAYLKQLKHWMLCSWHYLHHLSAMVTSSTSFCCLWVGENDERSDKLRHQWYPFLLLAAIDSQLEMVFSSYSLWWSWRKKWHWKKYL